jgi:hypothetical protein
MFDQRATFPFEPDTVETMSDDWQMIGRKDVSCYTPDGDMPAALTTALATLEQSCAAAALDTLDNDPPLSARLIWISVTDERDARHFAMLRRRAEDEALSLIVAVQITLLDAAWEAFEGCHDVTILVAPEVPDIIAAIASQTARGKAVLHSPVAEARERQIEALQDEVQRIARMLARLSMDDSSDGSREPPSPFIEDHHVHAAARSYGAEPADRGGRDVAVATVSAREVRTVIRQRRLRDELFDPELFADPAWDMMLDLYAAKLDRGRVSVSSLCIAAAVPATTALRWIKTLTDTGIFVRQADQHDGRRIFVTLSDAATQAMHRYFARLSEARLAI